MHFKQFQKNDYARLAMIDGAILAHHTGLGKSWAAYTWPLLKVGYAKSSHEGRTLLTPNAPVLLVSPGDLHQQLTGDGSRFFKVHTTRLDSQATFLKLSSISPDGRRTLPPGFYITSYTQLGVNGVEKLPDPDTSTTALLLRTLGWEKEALAKDYDDNRIRTEQRRTSSDPKDPPWAQLNCEQRDIYMRRCARQTLIQHAATIGETRQDVKCVLSPSLADLCQDSFACVVVDEATKMKGKETLVALGVRQLTPKYRLVMSATPIKLYRIPFYAAWLTMCPDLQGKPLPDAA